MLVRWRMGAVREAEGAPAGAAPGASATPAPAAASPAPAAAPAPASPAAAPLAFAETLPEDIRGEAAFRDIKDLAGLAKGYLGLQKMIGHRPEDLIVIPKADDEAGWQKVAAQLGRPETPDKYGLKPAAGVTVDEKLQSGYLDVAHKAGLSTKQADALFRWWNGAAGQATQAAAAAKDAQVAQATAQLKQEFGAAFEQNMALAEELLNVRGSPQLLAELKASGLNNNPELIKFLVRESAKYKEDGLIGKAGAGSGGALSPAEAQQQINALYADKDWAAAATDKRHPGHADAVAKMTKLFEMKAAATP